MERKKGVECWWRLDVGCVVLAAGAGGEWWLERAGVLEGTGCDVGGGSSTSEGADGTGCAIWR